MSRSSKEKITEAFRDLIASNAYAAISVTDIITLADVSRISFYRNFEDKPSLVTSLCLDDFRAFTHVFGKNATWKQIMTCILNSIKYNPTFYRNILLSEDGLDCVTAAMKKVSLEHTTAVGNPAMDPVIKDALNNWTKKKFSASVESVYTAILSHLPACELLSESDLKIAMAKYEARTIGDFKSENADSGKVYTSL